MKFCIAVILFSLFAVAIEGKTVKKIKRATPTCDSIQAFYNDNDYQVGNCTFDAVTKTFYWDVYISQSTSLTFDAANFACIGFAGSTLAAIRSNATVAVLKDMLPNGALASHWLNFRINQKYGSNFFEALQVHGWVWQDNTPFNYHNWYYNSNYVNFPGCLAIYTADGQIGLDSCSDSNKALCQLVIA